MDADPASLNSFFLHLLPYIAPALLTDAQKGILQGLGQKLPLVSLGSFEMELDDPLVKLDLAINLVRQHGEWDALLRTSSDLVKHSPILFNFLETYLNPSAKINTYVPNLWLSLDNHTLPNVLPSTWFYVGLPPHPLGPEIEKLLTLKTIEQLSPVLFEQFRPEIERILSHIQGEQRLSVFAPLAMRGVSKFRLIVSHFSKSSDLIDFLRLVNWPGDRNWLRSIVDLMMPMVVRCDLAIDIDHQIGEEIGLELFMRHCEDFEHIERFLLLINQFHPLIIEKIQSIPNYIGREKVSDSHHWTPVQGMRVEEQPCLQTATIHRWVMHVKVVFAPAKITKVKLYLGFMYVKDTR